MKKLKPSNFPQAVKIVEVAARDGLQNEQHVNIEDRIQLINDLSSTGLTHIEAGAFVSPNWVPQMADSDKVLSAINRLPNIQYSALVPNLKGYHAALKSKVDQVAIITSASETFSQKNTNSSISQSLDKCYELLTQANADQIKVRGYVSCVLGCPYEGEIDLKQVSNIAKHLYDMGCEEISLGDTIGVGTAIKSQKMLAAVAEQVPIANLAVHFHDTYGQALANILTCLQLGVTTIDASVAGLGGCPYAAGASGNVATEDVVYMLNGLGIQHGVNLEKLAKAGDKVCQKLNRANGSKVANALLAALN